MLQYGLKLRTSYHPGGLAQIPRVSLLSLDSIHRNGKVFDYGSFL